jgi:uncharacterized membrane protein
MGATDDQPGTTGDGAGGEEQPDETDARLNRLETEQTKQAGLLQQILTKVSGSAPAAPPAAQQATAAELDKGGVVQEVLAELGRRSDQAAETAEAETIAQRVAKLEEKPPREPLRKVTRAMFGAD